MKFQAELKTTKQRKTASSDNVYEITFATDNPMILDLAKLPSHTNFGIEVEIAD